MSGCSQMKFATTSTTRARKALTVVLSATALVAAAPAQASLWTDGEDYTGPFIDLASRADLGAGLPDDAAVLADYGFTYGPVSLPGMVFTRSAGETNSGLGAVLGQGDYDLGRNGQIGGAAFYAGLDSLTGYMDFRLTGGPVSRFGAWVNYMGGLGQDSEGLSTSPFIAALGANGEVIESWDLAARAPISTPDAVIARVNTDVNDMLKDPAVKATLDAQGLTAVGGSAADFRRVIDGDVKRWGPVISRLGIKLD